MARCRSWLITNKDVITAVKDLVTIIGLTLGLISIVVAICQLRITAASIKSNTVYQISHEGREIAKSISQNMPVDRIGQVVSFVQTVWNQHRLGTYPDDLWEPFREEVCRFLRSQEGFDDYWTANQQLFAKRFAAFIEERRRQCI